MSTEEVVESFEEWQIFGDPGYDYPPYSFTFSPDRNPNLGDSETSAKRFVKMVRSREDYPWTDGPHIRRRTVMKTAWKDVE